jgi:CBS domain-containing protein
MRKVADILRRKGNHVTTVEPSITVIDALHIMAEQNIGSVVVAMDGKFLGIMTERDYSRKVILNGRSSTDTTVGEIMTKDFPPVTATDTVEHCMALLSTQNLRYLPVMNGDTLAGIISINDVVKETILTQQETISHLQDYIHS